MEKKLPNDIFFAEVERLISEGREVRMKVKGTSMRPFLQNGDTVVLIPLSEKKLHPGTIVLFRHNGKHILHRLRKRDGKQLIIQGDSVPTVEKASEQDVVAMVKEVIKSDGRTISDGSRHWNREYRTMLCRNKLRSFLSCTKRRIVR